MSRVSRTLIVGALGLSVVARAASAGEGEHIELSAESIAIAGIETEEAGPRRIFETIEAMGRIETIPDRTVRIGARFGGVVTDARKSVGDEVAAGDVLAVVQSSASLQSYEVRTPRGGVVIERNANAGEVVSEGAVLYVAVDLDEVWLALDVARRDLGRVERGRRVIIDAQGDNATGEAVIDYVGMLADAETQATTVRATLDNKGRSWRPGWFVTGRVVVGEPEVPVAVPPRALQTVEGKEVVFVREGDVVFEARPVETGRRDADWVEVRAGLEPGESYVAKNSFVLKTELGKAGASHDH
jgi:cobalt-zinc-cadmium efflux system membrane fusion protein